MTAAAHRWWQAGVIYQIYPRSFQDSDGDGVGDLRGIAQRLPYLRELGVDAVWISPFYPSPMVDFGYDITDHCAVDPLFGTLADFDALIAAAHRLGIRVLVDFVPNHTSDAHPWFVQARADRSSAHRDWYLWADPAPDGGPPNNWRSVFGGAAWTFDDRTGQYYYHAYLPQQPDLNWRNPSVRDAMAGVLRFWLGRGVDGFRIDACRQLIKDDRLRDNPPDPDYRPGQPPYDELMPIHTTDRPEVLEVLAGLRRVLDEHHPDGVLLGEMYLPVERLAHYYGAPGSGVGDAVHLPSNMHLIAAAYRAEEIAALVERYERALPAHGWPNWVLGNHDRSRIATRVGAARARVAAMLLLTLRGTPVVYYGDELGMTDVAVPDELVRDPYALRVPGLGVGRDPERGPMQWTSGSNAGFAAAGVTPWLPPAADAAEVNVEHQRSDPHSMLALYRGLITLRRSEPALSVGEFQLVSATDDVLVYRRVHERRSLLVALNLGTSDRAVPLDSGGEVLLSTNPDRAGEQPHDALLLAAAEGVLLSQP